MIYLAINKMKDDLIDGSFMDTEDTFTVIHLNTLKILSLKGEDIIGLVEQGYKVLNIEIVDGKVKVGKEKLKYKICGYANKELELDITFLFNIHYNITEKSKRKALLPKVDKSLLDDVKIEYDKYISKSRLFGYTDDFKYIVLDKDNIILDRYEGNSEEFKVPGFINSIARGAFKPNIITMGARFNVLAKAKDKNIIKTIKLNKNVRYIDLGDIGSMLDCDNIKEKLGVIEYINN